MARDVADFVPGAAHSSIVLRALGTPATVDGTAPPFRRR